jgi:hypothetical protein
MDEQSASLNWHDLFLQGQQPNLLDELKFLASPISETTALSKAKTSYHKRTKRIQATETENESTHTVSGALVKNTQAKRQTTPTIVKNPEGKAKRGHPLRTPRKDKSTDGGSAVEVSAFLAFNFIRTMMKAGKKLISPKRRKLQVKLAQRAYRQRKEDTAIALERKCDTLKSTIRHLNEELDRFYKMSCQLGIGNREPEYMKDLKQTTKYMSDLVNLALDEVSG